MSDALKRCFKCGAEKPRADYYAHPMMRDGLLGKCKECTKKDAKKVRDQRIDYYREHDRIRAMRPEAVQRRREYEPRWREAWPEKNSAHQQVARALRAGKLERKPCEVCGDSSLVHAHHDDYARPLDVMWLCPIHHHERHKQLRAQQKESA